MSMRLVFCLTLMGMLYFCACNKDTKAQIHAPKNATIANFEIKGISFAADNFPIDSTHISPLKRVNCNWIAQMPFAFGQMNHASLRFDPIHSWWGETDKGITTTTQLARLQGIKTMLKPQIWMHGDYTGKFTLQTEKDWQTWEGDYAAFILHFAKLADSLQIEMFCVGTELRMVVKERPIFWSKLIDSVRTVYDGKLVYAADWADYQEVPFWNKLDYIGIDAYFPLSKSQTPSINELESAWQVHIKNIESVQKKTGKELIFTEIGYKSVDKCAHEPWSPTAKQVNTQAQCNAIQAFITAFANKNWFKGAFIWKWYPNDTKAGGEKDNDFTPQNKPTEAILKRCY